MSTRLVSNCLFGANQLNGKSVEFHLAKNDNYPFSQGAEDPSARGVGELIAHKEGTGFILDVLVHDTAFKKLSEELCASENVQIMLTEQAASRIQNHPDPNTADFLIPEQITSKHSNQSAL